jgi:glycolate oxidase FAD binding subunit
MNAVIEQFRQQILAAAAEKRALRVRGGGSRDFYGVEFNGKTLETRPYTSVVEYEPTELVITARAGTRLSEIEATLSAGGQMLAFEPPYFGANATIGGAIASGFSGPRRAYTGSARDFVLGVRILNGAGEDLRFGGQVMKNVAGFDVSRLMTGSFGTLGLILEVSLKILPLPALETTLQFECDEATAIGKMNRWAAEPLPLSATCYVDGVLSVRLSGAQSAVAAAQKKMGGDAIANGKKFWCSVRDHEHAFFSGNGKLWRLSIKPTTTPLALGPQLIEWNGSLRWVLSTAEPAFIHAAAQAAGGHATLFRGNDQQIDIQQLAPAMLALHRRVKHALDPNSVFGPRRISTEF